MNPELERKETALIGILGKLQGCAVAFSGGLDSMYLALMAGRHVAGKVMCVTVADASTPKRDLDSARKFAKEHGLEHLIISSRLHPEVKRNSPDRCYHCKRQLFRRIEEITAKDGLTAILDGENSSDSADDRPGSKAARECGVISPLAEAGLTKTDIRELAKETGIAEWSRPASACLSSRIPFNTEIDDDMLRKIDATEDFIRSKGIRMIRARAESKGVRLELGRDENTAHNRAKLEALKAEIMAYGWDNVETDPGGYVPAGLRSRKNGE